MPPLQQCWHLEEGDRCSIYERRPHSCRAFECLWLQGLFEGAQRPDRVGLVADVTADNPALPQAAVLTELYPNAADTTGRELVAFCAARRTTIIKHADGRRTLKGPPQLTAPWLHHLQQLQMAKFKGKE